MPPSHIIIDNNKNINNNNNFAATDDGSSSASSADHSISSNNTFLSAVQRVVVGIFTRENIIPTVAPAVDLQGRGPAYDAANGAHNPSLAKHAPSGDKASGATRTTFPEWNVHRGPTYSMVV
mmetsp:Transcript_28117/g.41532  ORF Transcript_28117/g.41532 Transcript_28117/m.41532 type:complete len:122 (+) Transcript_28117:69-434(+)|eukprot:CAMPEP_0194199476 /NCGR_PEP_ID=MMETSP0156-20130528/477_1 /TAXON_ID=33649 /ORGANISM="Thalassionema nitzschioides, Strain L26-B" /LENGTH=121 /DNA_ID=CAMNT_0038924369 /DNA_START=442 /DNA_END=807 /DNA_ORIENTATION=-